ncbi:hypothetical protein CC86DRAFT_190388 [Ophiobolus disseminans]|uniref:Uncharacterized protein n=1 Tax=Ophiobolus disseminans TaxID=1469910 RepID=A0A6A7A9Z9_9PLEO|nr:hypothetical protein CC86DRAFT_190388 [Ophiobolus disseminans]
MNTHTTWYPADQPDEAPQQLSPPYHPSMDDRSRSMPALPFRFVAFGESTPYPDHEVQRPVPQPFMVDLLSGDQWHRGDSLRQPVAEDFLRLQHPLPPPPIEEHDSDQELPVIEPDSYFEDQPSSVQFHDVYATDLGRSHTVATTKPLNIVKPDVAHRRSKSTLELALVVARPSFTARAEYDDSLAHISPMPIDCFTPVMGGLQRLPSAPLKMSKSQRLKRFFSFGRRRREYGRASR